MPRPRKPPTAPRRLLTALALLTVVAAPLPASAQTAGGGTSGGVKEAPRKPVLVAPKAVDTPEPNYPKAAARAGVSGEAIVRLTISPEGKVVKAEVTQDPGAGLGEALRQAALTYRFEPATKDGKPIRARILYKYAFREAGKVSGTIVDGATGKPLTGAQVTLTGPDGVKVQAQTDAAGKVQLERLPAGSYTARIEQAGFKTVTEQIQVATAEETTVKLSLAPTQGQLGGSVLIMGPDIPIAGARVTAIGPDGQEQVLTTDGKGRWSLGSVEPGKYRLRFEADGYKTTEDEVLVVAGEASDAKFRLLVDDGSIQVVVKQKRPPREVTRRTLERREVARIPGTGGDALRSIQSLPGVARPPGLAGLLIVRGSGPNDTETFVEGASIPLTYHFGGLSSVIPTELLERLDFYPGNFSAKYGRRQGGIVDIALREPKSECTGPYGTKLEVPEYGCYHGLLKVDFIDARFMLEGPVPFLDDWNFLVAGRRSWIDAWITPVLEAADAGVTSAPVYYDYQAVAETRPTPDSRLSVRGFGSDDALKLLITSPGASDPGFSGNLNFGTAFHRGQILYEGKLSRMVDLRAMLSVGQNRFAFSFGNLRFNLDTVPILARSEFGFKVARGVKINTGLDFQAQPFTVTVRAPPPPRPGEPDPGPFSSRPPLESTATELSFRPAWYVEGEITPTRDLRIVPGLRYDYFRDADTGDFSPRINARYNIVPQYVGYGDEKKQQLRTTIKGGVGMYTQPPEFQETNPVFGTPGIGTNKSLHVGLGVEQEFTKQIEISVEGFYKELWDQVARGANATGTFTYNNLGTGRIIGAETLLKYKPDDRFFGWVAYTLSRSERRDCDDCDTYLFQYDQTHILTILGSYRLGGGWEAGARFRVVSGPLVTPTNQSGLPSLYAADVGSYTALEGAPFSQRLPTFHALDVRIDRRWQFQYWRLSAFLDVQNIYNNPAVEALVYNFNFSQQAFQTGLPILPSVGIRGDF